MINVYIPTHKRSDIITSHRLFDDKSFKVFLVVDESETEDYKHLGLEIIAHKGLTGSMSKIRNFILDTNKEKYFIVCDDDISNLQCIEKGVCRNMTKEHVTKMIETGFVLAEDLNIKMWGINVNNDPKVYHEQRPFNLLSIVLGPFTAHIKHSIRYDEEFKFKEDYDFLIKMILEHKLVLRMNKYSYCTTHIKTKGGLAVHRTMDREREEFAMLQDKWGKKIIKKKPNSINPAVHIPRKGV